MKTRDLRLDDWPEVARIFEEGIQTGNATFETEVPSWDEWDAALLTAVIDSSERGGIWTLQTGVFPENEPSLRLLLRFGFRVVGTRERIGKLHRIWRDVVLLE